MTLGLLALMVVAQAVVLNAASSSDAATPVARASAAAACKRPAHGFVPQLARIPSIGRTVRVIVVKRTRSGAVGAPPVNNAGKWLMGMDSQALPAGRQGSVLLSGHTWPDGSALGNAMLRNLHVGDGIAMLGKKGKHACYRISERKSYPANQVPRRKAFRSWGGERLVIVACSGKRLGPGNWSRRTIWYAVPVLPPAPPKKTPPPSGQPTPSNGGLLGGLLGGL